MSDGDRARPDVICKLPRRNGAELRIALLRRDGDPPALAIAYFTSAKSRRPAAFVTLFPEEIDDLGEAFDRWADALESHEADS